MDLLCFSCRFTYEIAPVFVLMEQLTLKKMREIIGWPNGDGDGLFSPGKPIYNLQADTENKKQETSITLTCILLGKAAVCGAENQQCNLLNHLQGAPYRTCTV